MTDNSKHLPLKANNVYPWAASFYSLLFRNKKEELKVEEEYEFGEYTSEYTRAMTKKCMSMRSRYYIEEKLEGIIRRIIFKALNSNTKIRDIIKEMKTCEQLNNAKVYHKPINKESCSNCLGVIDKKVVLEYKHTVCKNYFIGCTLKSFLKLHNTE
jgi:hypothetical protein